MPGDQRLYFLASVAVTADKTFEVAAADVGTHHCLRAKPAGSSLLLSAPGVLMLLAAMHAHWAADPHWVRWRTGTQRQGTRMQTYAPGRSAPRPSRPGAALPT